MNFPGVKLFVWVIGDGGRTPWGSGSARLVVVRFVVLFDGFAADDQQARKALVLDGEHRDVEVLDADARVLARLRDAAEQVGHKPRDRVVVALGQVLQEVVAGVVGRRADGRADDDHVDKGQVLFGFLIQDMPDQIGVGAVQGLFVRLDPRGREEAAKAHQ